LCNEPGREGYIAQSACCALGVAKRNQASKEKPAMTEIVPRLLVLECLGELTGFTNLPARPLWAGSTYPDFVEGLRAGRHKILRRIFCG
jgi:hypothetical protein